MVCSWIRPNIILNNMNIIFPFFFSLFEWLAVIIWIIQENSIKWNKLKKYRKSSRNVPHWNMEYQVLYEDCRKSLEVKSERKKYGLPSVKKWHSANHRFAECQEKTLGKGLTAAALCRVFRHSANLVFAECYCLPSARHSANHLFAECFLSVTRQIASLPSVR